MRREEASLLSTKPPDIESFMRLSWDEISPWYDELEACDLTPETVHAFLADWTALFQRLDETSVRLQLATNQNTQDSEAEARYQTFLMELFPRFEAAEQRLKQKLLASEIVPPEFELPLRNLQAQAEIFRPENLPLMTRERELEMEYNKIIGAQTVIWDGRETPLALLAAVYEETDRDRRERSFRLAAERQLQDRKALNAIWRDFLRLRVDIAANAGCDDYRSFRWQYLQRFAYTPDDAAHFHAAIEEVVVPAASRLLARRSRRLGLGKLRPWDLQVDTLGRPPLAPSAGGTELEERTAAVFRGVDPDLGRYFDTMRSGGLLDLENRAHKAPGGFCTQFAQTGLPFIFMNAVGRHSDVQTLLHEGGHAFHVFESRHLPYYQQRQVGMEFNEVASMAMELLAAPYINRRTGGFYGDAEAARACSEQLQAGLLLWPRLAAMDMLQHWIYLHPDEAIDPDHLDAHWLSLQERFVPDVDWSGLEDARRSGWHGVLHIFLVPFYMIEYGLAQLGAVQIWSNALYNQEEAVRRYRSALALGGTRPIDELFQAAGGRLAFDAQTLGEAVQLMENTIEELEAQN